MTRHPPPPSSVVEPDEGGDLVIIIFDAEVEYNRILLQKCRVVVVEIIFYIGNQICIEIS